MRNMQPPHGLTANMSEWLRKAMAGQTEDLRYPAQGINPPGAASDPARNASTGLLEFSASKTNVIAGVAQMPHGRMTDSDIVPHVHVYGMTNPVAPNDIARWQLSYRTANINAARPAAYTTVTADQVVAAHVGGQPIHQIVSFGPLSGVGIGLSACMEWVVSRLGADGADTYPGIVTLLEFDLHVEINSLGQDL
ncbi:MAG: hypothetical protein IPG96_16160 [Proteobacteria bacterium]|nr:hypothetical protein [Pseudomonadota bacterium]